MSVERPAASDTSPSEPAESQEQKERDAALPTVATEAVLAEVDRAHRGVHGAGRVHSLEEITHLNESIHSCECGALFDEYVAGSVPNFQRMFSPFSERIEQASLELKKDAEQLGPAEVAEELRVLSLLKGRERQVHSAVQRYVQSVIRFDTLRKLSHGGVREDKEYFVDADQSRRRLHNALIESLRVYLKTAQEAEKMNLFGDKGSESAFITWDIGLDARSIPNDRALIFSYKTLERREFVRDWAIVAFFAERLQ